MQPNGVVAEPSAYLILERIDSLLECEALGRRDLGRGP
jgi:hypothetical protein